MDWSEENRTCNIIETIAWEEACEKCRMRKNLFTMACYFWRLAQYDVGDAIKAIKKWNDWIY